MRTFPWVSQGWATIRASILEESPKSREGTRLADRQREIARNRPGSRYSFVLRCPSTGTKALECGDFPGLWRETRKGETPCWSEPDLNFRDPSARHDPILAGARVSIMRAITHHTSKESSASFEIGPEVVPHHPEDTQAGQNQTVQLRLAVRSRRGSSSRVRFCRSEAEFTRSAGSQIRSLAPLF
jgi:hypothetical protein